MFLKSRAFSDEFGPRRSIVVCNERQRRRQGRIDLLPLRDFLDELWGGRIIAG